VVSFAGTAYACGRRWARQAIDVTIVAGSVQLSRDGKVIRVHPIRHDRSRELRQRQENLHDGVLGGAAPGQTFIQVLHWYAGLQGRLQAARQPFAQRAPQVDEMNLFG
jgi:hypothetical protein